jgi:hypothetical protein
VVVPVERNKGGGFENSGQVSSAGRERGKEGEPELALGGCAIRKAAGGWRQFLFQGCVFITAGPSTKMFMPSNSVCVFITAGPSTKQGVRRKQFLAFVAKCKGPRQRAWKRSARCRALFAAASMCDNLVWQSRTCRLHPAPHCVKMLPAPVRQDYWRLFLASAVWPGPVL